MFNDTLWKALYRSYLVCIFFTAAAFEAYLVYHVGYAPSSISDITRVALPAALMAVPIVALIILPTFLLFIIT